jgi:pyruvate carboxylase subunit B
MYRVKHAQGVDITRIFCGLNEVRNIIPSIRYAKEAGMIPQATLCITYSPVHTVDYYAGIAEQLIAAGAPEICLKDMAGIGRPELLGQLVGRIKQAHPEVLIQYHGHSGPGLSMASILEVCKHGADIIDVAVEPLSWGKVHPDVISVQAMLKTAGFDVPDIDMKAYMKVRSLTQEFIDDFLGYFMDPTNKHMSSLLLGCGLPGGMMGSMMADLKGAHSGINLILKGQGKEPLSLDDLVVMLFDEVEYVWPKLGYPPLVTPFSQYVKNVALMNVMALLKGEERWTQIDRFTWDMILGKSGKLPGPLAPEIIELARQKGYEFTEADPQSYYPDQLDEYRKEMDENGWDYGPDDEELFELAMHDRQYRDYKSGVAKERFLADLQRAKDAALSRSGMDEETIRRMKRAKAQPIAATERGQVIWEVAVDGPSQAPAPGRIYRQGETFCLLATPWGAYETVVAPFDGVLVDVAVKQGEQAQRGAALAYLERT